MLSALYILQRASFISFGAFPGVACQLRHKLNHSISTAHNHQLQYITPPQRHLRRILCLQCDDTPQCSSPRAPRDLSCATCLTPYCYTSVTAISFTVARRDGVWKQQSRPAHTWTYCPAYQVDWVIWHRPCFGHLPVWIMTVGEVEIRVGG
ncbi:hypothetical protein EX30DRAFT_167601 [Ascodesmis nigricans]|uniref:Uncharacterized protein n=1 Tax=Ascodesmis nigricans TaxID=341454 RepID=A0A4S2MM25_9PEZI|nr:hypothetical protein EX30DRAFT_167601 [Ascodesmis nigricans]